MGRIDDLNDMAAEVRALKRAVRDLQRATPLSNASIGRGRLRLYDGSELLIEGGNLRVTGTGTIEGTLSVTGTLNVTGTTNLDGPVVIDGATTINGATGLNGNMTVSGGGTIVVGDMTLSPTISATGGAGGLSAPAILPIQTPIVVMSGDLTVTDMVDAARIYVDGNVDVGTLNVRGLTTKAAVAANLHVDAAGKIWKV